MSTIAWDGRTLAADCQSTTSAGLKRHVEKIFRMADGSIFGSTGGLDEATAVRNWLAGQAEKPLPAALEDFTAVLIKPDASVWLYEKLLNPWRIFNAQHAIGSGRDFAISAMAFGKSATESVEFASQFDAYTGSQVQKLSLRSASLYFWLEKNAIGTSAVFHGVQLPPPLRYSWGDHGQALILRGCVACSQDGSGPWEWGADIPHEVMVELEADQE